ncbi:MAG: flagellar biosynthesis protein FlhB [Proteobacteria bacterium]|nr:flagellar biosynthesis protein FlhB [Pseudomonadota bacterium]
MADETDSSERTEDPTQKKLDDALKRGDVAKSQEVNTWFIISAATLALLAFSGTLGRDLTASMRGLIANAHGFSVDGGALPRLAARVGAETVAAIALPFLLLMLAALAGNVIQHRLVWSGEGLKPKLSKISPAAGLKRLFSKQALANFIKGLVKLAVIGTVLCLLLWPSRFRLEGLAVSDPVFVLPLAKGLTLDMLAAVVAIMALVAAADYLFQYRQWFERQKMSPRELKDEFKETDGDPKIKARIRQLRQARMRKRMMAAVPNATVVVTNPTHFAVALRYERGMNAPLCVAKGQDAIALKIREVANRHGVPIVENPPLARTLHAAVKVDGEIPPEHYRAVAEIIGYVMRLNRAAAR